ncbi:MAG: GNAT family N-acetyltransferase [Rhizobiales bacterium]|nr:GNAT family N-acetyltransferase [Hyphomicrobiales bacterium]
MIERGQPVARILPAISAIAAGAWDACANPAGRPLDPFLSHAFLLALEESRSVAPRTGWQPRHIVIEDASGSLRAAMPCYLKSHSRGEYIFDHGWAEAYERAGGRYYPKLLSGVPFTPVTGRRFLSPSATDDPGARTMLLSAAIQLCEQHGISSFHANFLTRQEWEGCGALGLLQRTDQQFHWHNAGYSSFDDFLATLASRKRKALRKEREAVRAAGLTITWHTGGGITEDHWDAFFTFYQDTGSRKWGSPYLNREFFSLIGTSMADRLLLVLARRAGRPIAGALNLIGGDTLYGRYWGCTEHHPFLHFELCYYQAIDFAIAHRLAVVEAGAQGEHKLARGYLPTTTYSAHWIADPGFRRAVADYLERERAYVAEMGEALASQAPYRRGPAEGESGDQDDPDA